MQIEAPPVDRACVPPAGERRGLVLVPTGDGKGKSTAAFGLALRAHGRGKAVQICQFVKVPSARFGEHRVFAQLGLPIAGLGDGFSWKSRDLDHSGALACLRELADTVTEMQAVKHHDRAGLPAQRGIED